MYNLPFHHCALCGKQVKGRRGKKNGERIFCNQTHRTIFYRILQYQDGTRSLGGLKGQYSYRVKKETIKKNKGEKLKDFNQKMEIELNKMRNRSFITAFLTPDIGVKVN